MSLPQDCYDALKRFYEETASLKKVGARLATAGRPQGYSAAAISQLISGTYAARDTGRIEAAIRATLLSETVTCPVLGEIGLADCMGWQAKPFAATNPQRVRMYRACRSGCPHARIEE